MKEDFCIPLLITNWHDFEEHVFAIVNNKVIFYKPYWDVYPEISNQVNALLFLYNNLEKVIPIDFHKYFKGVKKFSEEWNTKKEIIEKEVNTYKLVSVSDAYERYTISYSINIDKSKKQSIQLTNFSLTISDENKEKNIISLNQILDLTPVQAFILFSNNCLSYFDSIIKSIISGEKNKSSFFPESQLNNILSFSMEYIEWLKRKMNTGEISPIQILKYNGYKTLSHLLIEPVVQDLIWETIRKLQNYKNLSKFELVLYYIFYGKLRYSDYLDILRRWGIITGELKSPKILSIDDENEIDNILKNLKNK